MWAVTAIFAILVDVVLAIYIWAMNDELETLESDLEKLEKEFKDREGRTPDFFKDIHSPTRGPKVYTHKSDKWTQEWEDEHRRF